MLNVAADSGTFGENQDQDKPGRTGDEQPQTALVNWKPESTSGDL